MARIDPRYWRIPGLAAPDGRLPGQGWIPISRDRVPTPLCRMGLRATYQKPRTTDAGDPSRRFPCLVDVSTIKGMDHVCATDNIYIPLQKGSCFCLLQWISSHCHRVILNRRVRTHTGGEPLLRFQVTLQRTHPTISRGATYSASVYGTDCVVCGDLKASSALHQEWLSY
jgi:hypothetical protein